MALWQFQCYIIPKLTCTMGFNNDELLSWKGKEIPLGSIDFLEKSTCWTKDIVQYGKEDETCIQFFYVNGLLEEINCKLDLRSLSKKTLEKIVSYVKEIDGMIFCEGEIYPPAIDEIVKLMKKSNANKFCQNPKNYFEELFSH